MTTLGILWFVLIAVLMTGYFVLDGFDLGAGVLYPFLAKDEEERAIVRRAIGPVWDGNEVWLLTAGGALFAAFPAAYATSFSGFYLAIMLVLFGLIVRAVCFEYRAHGALPKGLCDAFFFVGSLLPALLFGVAVGNVVAGIALNANGDYTGTFFGLLTPFTLACGVLGLVHMMAQGAAWVALKAPADGELRTRAAGMRRTLAIADLVVFALVTILFFATVVPGSSVGLHVTALAVVFAVVYVIGVVIPLLGKGDLAAMLGLSLACAGLVGLMAATMFPNLIVASNDAALSVTVASAASSDTALGAMTVIACIGVPLVLIYHVIVYRIYRGRLSKADLQA